MPKSRKRSLTPQTKQPLSHQVAADTSDQALLGNAAVQASLAGSTKQSIGRTPHDVGKVADWSGPGDTKLAQGSPSARATVNTKMKRAQDLMNKAAPKEEGVPGDVSKEPSWYDRLINPMQKVGGVAEPDLSYPGVKGFQIKR